ncbi:hypothetical protein [Pseudomonas rhizoryzae]|uniref:hypothetical protein n=1 Tax=Pseudomonas rhizoryzae TaxID=2571129 RepID=UPI0010C17BC1|nr:hypothetical protein [Pseudomonas rhizoryzae]
MTINDGGRAFPRTSDAYGPEFGMSLRDYFAAKAMQGCNANLDEQFTRMNLTAVAQMAYQQADEMLAAREVQP